MGLRKSTARKREYLDYFEKHGTQSRAWGEWLRFRRKTKGLSKQTRGQLSHLSKGDRKSLEKFFR